MQKAQAERAKAVLSADSEAKRMLGRAAAHLGEDYFEAVYLNGADLDRASSEEIETLFSRVEWDPYEELMKRKEREMQKNASAQSREELEPTGPAVTDPPVPPVLPAAPANQNAQIENSLFKLEEADEMKSAATGAGGEPKGAREQVIVQVDEVVVRKQPGGKREKIVHYNGVVKTEQRSYYCSGITSAQLIYQAGSLLAQLGVHRDGKSLLVLSDCAGWITNWAVGCGTEEKEILMCWHHLRERCRELIGEAFTDKSDREEVRKRILKYLRRGDTDKALSYLKKLIEDAEDGLSKLGIKGIREIEAIRNYLMKRRAYITDYQRRVKNKEWIASTQIEKFNDFAVSARCKGEGRRWTSKGVSAIAALETADAMGS